MLKANGLSMNPTNDPHDSEPASEAKFQHIVEISTAIGLGTVFGTVACLEWKEYEGPSFHWHWPVLLWIGVGVAAGIYFWRQIWHAQDAPPGHARMHLFKAWAALAAASGATFAYSVRTFRLAIFKDVLLGVFAASVVLSFIGWVIFRLMRLFESDTDGGDQSS